jgi:hypothetical protein
VEKAAPMTPTPTQPPGGGPKRPVVRPRGPVGSAPRRPVAPRNKRPPIDPNAGINRQVLEEAKRAAKPALFVAGGLLGLLALVGLGGLAVVKATAPSIPAAARSPSAVSAQDSARLTTVIQDVLSFADDNTVVALLSQPFNATSPTDGKPIQLTWSGENPPPSLAAALTAGHTLVADTVHIGTVQQDAGLWACDFTVQTTTGGHASGHAEGRANTAGGTPLVKTLTYSPAQPTPVGGGPASP